MSCPSSMRDSVSRSHFIALLGRLMHGVELGADHGVEHGAGVDLGGDLVHVADHVLDARAGLGDDLDAPVLLLHHALDGEVRLQEALGERHRHGDRVGDHLEHLGGELGEGAGVQVAVLDEPEEHRLEVGVGAQVARLARPAATGGVVSAGWPSLPGIGTARGNLTAGAAAMAAVGTRRASGTLCARAETRGAVDDEVAIISGTRALEALPARRRAGAAGRPRCSATSTGRSRRSPPAPPTRRPARLPRRAARLIARSASWPSSPAAPSRTAGAWSPLDGAAYVGTHGLETQAPDGALSPSPGRTLRRRDPGGRRGGGARPRLRAPRRRAREQAHGARRPLPPGRATRRPRGTRSSRAWWSRRARAGWPSPPATSPSRCGRRCRSPRARRCAGCWPPATTSRPGLRRRPHRRHGLRRRARLGERGTRGAALRPGRGHRRDAAPGAGRGRRAGARHARASTRCSARLRGGRRLNGRRGRSAAPAARAAAPQRPSNSGARFSRKAAMPSVWSSLANASAKRSRSMRCPVSMSVSAAACTAALQ